MVLIQIKCGDKIILRSKDEIIETQLQIIESQIKVIKDLRKKILELEIKTPLLPLIQIIPEIGQEI